MSLQFTVVDVTSKARAEHTYPWSVIREHVSRSLLFKLLLEDCKETETLHMGPYNWHHAAFIEVMSYVFTGVKHLPNKVYNRTEMLEICGFFGVEGLIDGWTLPNLKYLSSMLTDEDKVIYEYECRLRDDRARDRDHDFTDEDSVFLLPSVVNATICQPIDMKLSFFSDNIPNFEPLRFRILNKYCMLTKYHSYAHYHLFYRDLILENQKYMDYWLDHTSENFVNHFLPSKIKRKLTKEVLQDLCIAGGTLYKWFTFKTKTIYSWTKDKCKTFDVDVFITTTDPDKARLAITRLIQALDVKWWNFHKTETAMPANSYAYMVSENALTFWVLIDAQSGTYLRFQVILRLYNSIVQVLTEFDLDCCRAAWDGSNIFVAPSFVRSLSKQYTLIYPEHHTYAYGFRMAKYLKQNMGIVIPGLQLSKIVVSSVWSKKSYGLAGAIHNCWRRLRSLNAVRYIEGLTASDNPTPMQPGPIYEDSSYWYVVNEFLFRLANRHYHDTQLAVHSYSQFYDKKINTVDNENWDSSSYKHIENDRVRDYLIEHNIQIPFRIYRSLEDVFSGEDKSSTIEMMQGLHYSVPPGLTFSAKLRQDQPSAHHCYEDLYTYSDHDAVQVKLSLGNPRIEGAQL